MSGVIDHVDLVVDDLDRSARLYEAALEPLGFQRLFEDDDAIGFGTTGNDDFWLRQAPQPMAPITTGVHLAFVAKENESVDQFFRRAIHGGAREDKAPAYRAEFHEGYYAAFVWDFDGNHIEAVNHNR